MTKHVAITKWADSKGRVTLGRAFANKVVLIEKRGDAVILRPGRVIPEREAWLYENDKALNAVRKGLEQARRGGFVEGPDLSEARKLADHLQDE